MEGAENVVFQMKLRRGEQPFDWDPIVEKETCTLGKFEFECRSELISKAYFGNFGISRLWCKDWSVTFQTNFLHYCKAVETKVEEVKQ